MPWPPAPAWVRLGQPLVLTGANLPDSVATIVTGADRVELFGGTAVITAAIEQQLRSLVA